MSKKVSKKSNEKLTSKEGQTRKPSKELKPVDKEELRQMIIEDPNISHISDRLGVSRSTVRHKIKIYRLKVVLEISKENHRKLLRIDEKKLQYCRLYMQSNGIRKIAKDHHTSPLKVKKALIERGFDVLEAGKHTKVVHHVKDNNFYLPISDKLLEMFIGQLLGDASLRIMKKFDLSIPEGLDFGEYYPQIDFLRSFLFMEDFEVTEELVQKFNYARKVVSDYPTAIFRFSQGVIENWNYEDWVKFSSRLCNNENYTNNPRYSNKEPNWFYYFDTIASVQLLDLYAKWYPNNKKVVPFDLEMTPNILLYWYIGDGSLSKNSFYIATQSFSKKEVDFLCDLLFTTFGLVCHSSQHRDGINLTISLEKENYERFFDYLDQADPDALALAKKIYPWKFDRYLTKDEALKSRK